MLNQVLTLLSRKTKKSETPVSETNENLFSQNKSEGPANTHYQLREISMEYSKSADAWSNEFLARNFEEIGKKIGLYYGSADLLAEEESKIKAEFLNKLREQLNKLTEEVFQLKTKVVKMNGMMEVKEKEYQLAISQLEYLIESLKTEELLAEASSGKVQLALAQLNTGFRIGLQIHIQSKKLKEKLGQ